MYRCGVAGWIVVACIVVLTIVGAILLFRSFRKWRQPAPATAAQVQAEMQLYAESRQTDRW